MHQVHPRIHQSAWHSFYSTVPFLRNNLFSLPWPLLAFTFFLAYFPYFEKIKSRFMVSLSCLSVPICASHLLTTEWLNQFLRNLVCIAWKLTKSQWHNLQSLPSITPTLRPLKFLGQNLNIAWRPASISMTFDAYTPHTLQGSSISSTNIIVSYTAAVITVILNS
jgi:hypothetical protein